MSLVLEVIQNGLRLCRKPPVTRIMQTSIGFGQEPVLSGQPAGSGGGLGSVCRGVCAALDGMKMLNRNRQLLWFGLFAGLVFAGNVFYYGAIQYLGWNLHISFGSLPVSYALEFISEFATMFFLVYLLAALVLGISSKNGGTASFFQGLIMAKKFKKSLAVWAFILAGAGMLLYYAWFYFIYLLAPEYRFLNVIGPFSFVVNTITQFPFNWTLDWDMLTETPGYGGRSLLLWIYPHGIVNALPVMGINILLLILTLFVVPLIVLEHKSVRESVAGSFAMIKKIPGEVASSVIFLGIIAAGAFLSHQLIQAVSGIVDPWETVMFHPSGAWIALALIYIFALVTVVLVMATVGGIAGVNLFTLAKNRLTDNEREKPVGGAI